MNPQDRITAKRQEQILIDEESKKNPELFIERTFIDDSATLHELGIDIPHKENASSGYLKLHPQDFIVEEISPTGTVYTVDYKPAMFSNTYTNQPTIYATLVKCGVSTIEVVEELCKLIPCSIQQIQYAGIKDKAAITAQRISFRNIPAEKILAIKSPHFFLKDLEAGKGAVEKSGLKGNRFTLVIRTQPEFFEEESFKKFLEQLRFVKEHGFYNFYYIQRFGTPRLVNFHWAYEILKGNYRNAVFSFLTQSTERELPFFRSIRKALEQQFDNWELCKKTMSDFPVIFSNELKVVEYLITHPTDFSGALNTIPEQITLWIYALSSWFFNKEISYELNLGKEPPAKLPLLLSFNQDEWGKYTPLLHQLDIYPPPFKNFKPFPYIQMRSRFVETKEKATIHAAEIIDEGILISFDLQKGDYATTFLAHLFNLMSGAIPPEISKNEVDSKKTLGEASLTETLEYFKEVLEERKKQSNK